MADLEYPLNGAENVYINPRWLTVPVQVPNSIANCYINGTGVADFTDNPAWDLGVFNSVAFHLRKRHLEIHCAHRWFISHSPAQPGDPNRVTLAPATPKSPASS